MLLPLGRACLPLQKQSKTKSPLVVKSHSHNPRMLRSLAGGLARRARHLRALSCSPATKLRSAGEVGGWWGAGVDTPSPFTLVSLQELVLHLYGASGFSETFHLGWLNGWGRRVQMSWLFSLATFKMGFFGGGEGRLFLVICMMTFPQVLSCYLWMKRRREPGVMFIFVSAPHLKPDRKSVV